MGFKFIRFGFIRVGNFTVGKAINWLPSIIKRYPLLSFAIIFCGYLLIAKLCFDDEQKLPFWYKAIFFIVSGMTYNAIDNQMPSRKYRSAAVLLGTFFLFFVGLVIYGVTKYGNFDAASWTIIAALLLISGGYSAYSLWRWRGRVIMCKDILLRRELRAKRKRKLVY